MNPQLGHDIIQAAMVDQLGELSQGKSRVAEYGFQEVRATDRNLVLDRTDLPWMPQREGQKKLSIAPLAIVTLKGGRQFYYGSAIVGKRLIEQADRMTADDSEQANKLFYAEVQRFLQGSRSKSIREPKTKGRELPAEKQRDIFYATNGSGVIRTYFMQMQDIDGSPVILRIATSSGKNSESEVLSELTMQNIKTVKKLCFGK